MKEFVIALILYLCISSSLQYPSNPICYDQVCPPRTTNCKKNVRTSADRKNLEVRINCLDDFDGSLKEYFFEEASIINPYTHYESSSYSAASGGTDDYYHNNNAVEDFQR